MNRGTSEILRECFKIDFDQFLMVPNESICTQACTLESNFWLNCAESSDELF